MDSGVVRDYFIIIGGGLILLTLVLSGILGFLLYRQIKALTKSVKETIHLTQELGTEVKEAAKSSKYLVSIIKPRSDKKETTVKTESKAGV